MPPALQDSLVGVQDVLDMTSAGSVRTVESWIDRGDMPAPEVQAGRARLWRRSTVCRWAAETDRLTMDLPCPRSMPIPAVVTVDDLAERAGVSRYVVYHWLAGNAQPEHGPLPVPLVRTAGASVLWRLEDIDRWLEGVPA